MTDLSPATAKVFKAAWADTGIILGDREGTLRAQLAASLRVVAQLNPGPFVPELFGEGWDAAMGELRNKAAILEGFEFIGIEREAAYHAIAERRIGRAAAAGYQPSLLP